MKQGRERDERPEHNVDLPGSGNSGQHEVEDAHVAAGGEVGEDRLEPAFGVVRLLRRAVLLGRRGEQERAADGEQRCGGGATMSSGDGAAIFNG